MQKDIKDNPTDDDPARLQQYIVQLETALADYAHRFGLTDKARAALNFKSAAKPRH